MRQQWTSPGTVLKVEGLTRSFGGRDVVSDVSLEVRPGQVTCLLGPSGLREVDDAPDGCGRRSSGQGVDPGGRARSCRMMWPSACRSATYRADVSGFRAVSAFVRFDNVAFGLKGTKREKMVRVGELLDRVHLEGFETAFPHELSGGEQQRVALARAVAPRPGLC